LYHIYISSFYLKKRKKTRPRKFASTIKKKQIYKIIYRSSKRRRRKISKKYNSIQNNTLLNGRTQSATLTEKNN